MEIFFDELQPRITQKSQSMHLQSVRESVDKSKTRKHQKLPRSSKLSNNFESLGANRVAFVGTNCNSLQNPDYTYFLVLPKSKWKL